MAYQFPACYVAADQMAFILQQPEQAHMALMLARPQSQFSPVQTFHVNINFIGLSMPCFQSSGWLTNIPISCVSHGS